MPQTNDNFSSTSPTINERLKDGGWPVWLLIAVVGLLCWTNWPSKGMQAAPPVQVTPTVDYRPMPNQPAPPQIFYVGYQPPTQSSVVVPAPVQQSTPAPINISNIIQLGDKQLTPIRSGQGQQDIHLQQSPPLPPAVEPAPVAAPVRLHQARHSNPKCDQLEAEYNQRLAAWNAGAGHSN